MTFQWTVKKFNQFTAREVYAIYKAREAVFVVEQHCPYEEVDARDLDSLHLFAGNEEQEVIAYSRIFREDDHIVFGRVLVSRQYRGQGLGRMLVTRVLEEIEKRYPELPVEIEAQAYIQSFYASFGFQIISEVFLLDTIPHIKMRLNQKWPNDIRVFK